MTPWGYGCAAPTFIGCATGPTGSIGLSGATGASGATGPTGATGPAPASAPYANVLDFGAVCDGITDDTAALQAAFIGAECIYFPTDGTCLVSDTVFLSHPNYATAVKSIIGNGSTIKFKNFVRHCTDNLSTVVFGFCSGSPVTSGNFSGWKGYIDNLNFETDEKLVMLGGSGCTFWLRECDFLATGVNTKGCMLTRNCIDMDAQNCTFDMQAVCIDTAGFGTFFTAADGSNIPSSFGQMYYGFPTQVDTDGNVISPTGLAFMDSISVRQCGHIGGQTQLLDGGTESNQNRFITGNKFVYNHYGIITNGAGFISSNWFENTKYGCLRTVTGGPPWYGGSPVMPLNVANNTFAPHSLTGVALLLDFIPSESSFIQNCFLDCPGGAATVGPSGLGNFGYWIGNTNPFAGPITGVSPTSGNTAFTILEGGTVSAPLTAGDPGVPGQWFVDGSGFVKISP